MKILSMTANTVTMSINDSERSEVGRLFGRFPEYEYSLAWTGPKTSAWWKAWDAASPGTRGDSFQPGTILEVADDHLKLLRGMRVDWGHCEFGAPEIDPKRPYGNSDVLGDMVQILGIPAQADENGDLQLPDDVVRRLNRLHRETQGCIGILLQHADLRPGRYRNDANSEYKRPAWVRLGDAPA